MAARVVKVIGSKQTAHSTPIWGSDTTATVGVELALGRVRGMAEAGTVLGRGKSSSPPSPLAQMIGAFPATPPPRVLSCASLGSGGLSSQSGISYIVSQGGPRLRKLYAQRGSGKGMGALSRTDHAAALARAMRCEEHRAPSAWCEW